MKRALLFALLLAAASTVFALPQVNVTQHHNNPSRDGLFIDPAFTLANAAALKRDTSFDGTIAGNVYAAPLYVEGGPDNRAKVIVATESNNVYALDAITGAIIWQRLLGTPITSGLPCGNINPLGVTATPVVDPASRALFLDAEISGAGHRVFSLNVDTGAINSGWPITMNSAVSGFDSSVQSSRAALGIIGNTLYVPYGGRFGDCGSYRGRLVAIRMDDPTTVSAYATNATRSGVWGPGGVASDGTNAYITTGNGPGGVTWNGSEAVIRLQPGASFSGATTDYWAPANWAALDSADSDLGGSGPILVDVPGATPSQLVVAIGKDRNAYLLNRNNLGGVGLPVAQASVSSGTVINAAAAYRSAAQTYVALRPVSGTLTAFKITNAAPPAIATGWSVSSAGRTSPFVTAINGNTSPIVWAFGTGAGARLFGYNGDTGAAIFGGGGANDTISGARSFNTGIAARGRIYLAGDNKVYAFTVPKLPISSIVSRKTHGDAGTFDIDLRTGVESRLGQGANNDSHQIVVTFASPVTIGGSAQVVSGTATVGNVSVTDNVATIDLTGVANGQCVTVTLNGVSDGTTTADTPIASCFLAGDTNGDATVNSGDVSQTRSRSGQTVDQTNFGSDLNLDGTLNSADVTIVRARSGTSLTAPAQTTQRAAKK